MKSTAEYIKLLQDYMAKNASNYGITRLGIFGSVARGEQKDDSDIDILYEGQPNLLLRIQMKYELEELLGCTVDITRLRKQLNESLFNDYVMKDIIYV